jgi:hypothetical protein
VTVTGVAPATVSAGAAANAPAAKSSEFERAKAAAEMRSARSMADVAMLREEDGVRRVGARSFTLRDSVWVDARPAASGARTVSVIAFSPAYFALIDRIPELREAFALGEKVQVHGRAVTLRLAADGVKSLDAAALAAITRDW